MSKTTKFGKKIQGILGVKDTKRYESFLLCYTWNTLWLPQPLTPKFLCFFFSKLPQHGIRAQIGELKQI
jgi:hypothetical protein